MLYFHFLAWSLAYLLPASGSNAQGSATAATASLQASSIATPICLQSRTSTDPLVTAIQSSVTSDNSINKACDPSTQQIRLIPWTHTFYALDNYYFFNTSLQDLPSISTPTSTPTSYPGNQNCMLNFNAIFSSCVGDQNFWGGWIESNGLNYSVSYTPPGTGSTSASSMSSSVGMRSSLSQGSETGSIQNGPPTTSGTPSGVSSSNSVGSRGSNSVQGSNSASAHNPSTNSAVTNLSLSQVSTSSSGQSSAPVTIGTRSGAFSSGGPSGSAVAPSVLTFDGVVLTGGPSGLTAGPRTTISPGESAVTISGHTFSLQPDGSSIAVDGALTPLSQGPAKISTANQGLSLSQAITIPTLSVATALAPRMYTFDGIVFTGGSSGLTAGTVVITPAGPPATLSGHTFSLGAAGSSINVDGNLSPLLNTVATTGPAPGSTSTAVAPSVTALAGSAYTLDGVVLTGNPSSGLTIANHIVTTNGLSGSNPSSRLTAADSTITPGGLPITVSGHTFSLPASATGGNIFVDGTLTRLPNPSLTNTASPGSSHSDMSAPVTTSAPKTIGTESQSDPVTSLGGSESQSAPLPSSSLGSDIITSTDTVQPSDASTEGTTNTAFSANYWLTTQVAGQTTVVPVIVGCPGCGGKGGGIILWNFPPIPSVSFQFPKLNLPSISFPCIPIPFIKSCSSPPTSGSLNPDDPNKPSPSDSKPSETQAKETDGKTSALSSVTPSSTGTLTGTSSAPPSTSSVTSGSACPLTSYTFSLTPGTDSTTLLSATGTDAITGSASSSALSSTANSACPLNSYSFSLPTGTDSTTLSTASGSDALTGSSSVTTTSSASLSASSGSTNSACPLTSYSFLLPPGTDSTTLSSALGSDFITDTNSGTISGQPSHQPTISTSANASNSKASLTSTLATTTAALPDCMADGAPWYSPTSWCDCGSGTYPTLPPVSGANAPSANCKYTSLDPSKTITPISTSAAPTNIPGVGGIPGCNYVLQGDEQGCTNVDYCNCGGTYVGLLTTTVSGTTSKNCDYTIQPTENDCPINTASVNAASTASVAAAMSISAASVASVATAFNPDKTTLSCGQKYSTDTGATYTSVPRAQTNDIIQNAATFCTPSENGAGDTLVFEKGKPISHSDRFDAPGLMLYQFNMVWDPRPECANVPAPEIRDSVPTGPDYWCNVYFDALTNTCDAGPGQDKNGGNMYAQCVIWSWEAFDGCTGKGADPNEC